MLQKQDVFTFLYINNHCFYFFYLFKKGIQRIIIRLKLKHRKIIIRRDLINLKKISILILFRNN